jgi:hypothetical protein
VPSSPQSGALQVPLGANRIEVLEILLEHSVDVNERLQEPVDHLTGSKAKREEASETPLHRAVKKKAKLVGVGLGNEREHVAGGTLIGKCGI